LYDIVIKNLDLLISWKKTLESIYKVLKDKKAESTENPKTTEETGQTTEIDPTKGPKTK
jgi:hypothetical protein